jgi:putative membrane protein
MIPELVFRFAGNLAALWVASEIFDEMTYGDSFWVLVLAAAVFTIVNFVVKPVIAILSIPFIIITLGIAYFFVNVLMLLITSWVVPDFAVGGFWTYVGATIVIWLVNLVIGAARRDIASSRARPRGADDLRY